MTKYEVKDKLCEYRFSRNKIEGLKKRIEVLKANNLDYGEINTAIKELVEQYKNELLRADITLANTLDIINQLDNRDCDVDVLKKYHIDGLSERAIARQLCFSVDYIRTKRWRAYEKLSKKESLK